jgi:hypothetical protein
MSEPADDAALKDLCLEYLGQYVRFMSHAPELIQKLAGDASAFAMVPVPRLLLERVCAARDGVVVAEPDPQMADPGHWLTPASARDSCVQMDDAPVRIAQNLATAFSTGSVDRVCALLSPNFLDQDARNADEIRSALAKLFSSTVDRGFTTYDAREIRRSEHACTVRIAGNWRATRTEQEPAAISEDVFIDVLLERHEDGQWKVLSIRSERMTT